MHTHIDIQSPMRANLIGLEGLVCAFTSTGTAIWKDHACKYDTCRGPEEDWTSEKAKGVADEDPGVAKYWIKIMRSLWWERNSQWIKHASHQLDDLLDLPRLFKVEGEIIKWQISD